jgi:uncharacterized protein
MNEVRNVELVKQIYANLEEDDAASLLAICALDVEWQYPPVKELPYGGLWRGPDGVARFVQQHDEAEELLDFNPSDLVAQGDHVAVLGTYRGRVKSTGHEWVTNFVHVLTIRNGKIQRFEAHCDTAAALEARRQ